MNDEQNTAAWLRQFLLGNLDEVERERIEKRFISDAEWKERILAAEEDLIEDYLEGSLSEPERRQFLSQYAATPRHLRRLQITKLIKQQAKAEAGHEEIAQAQRSGFFAQLWPLNPRFMIPAVAVLVIAFLAGIFFLVQFSSRRSQETAQRTAIEREIAELNSHDSSGQVAAHVASLVLAPVSVRSGSSGNELTRNPDTQVIELRLVWMPKEEYPSYRAVLQRVGASEQYTINDLKLLKDNSGRVVITKIPAHVLRRGLYQINLSGVGQPTSEPSQEYTFTIN
jgi:hypothetical protein